MDEDSTGGFSLSDFLSSGVGLYGQYLQGKNTTDQAKVQQQIAATQAAQQAQSAAQLKQIIIYGAIAITGVLLLVFVIKALKK